MVLTLKGAMFHLFSVASVKHFTDRRYKIFFFHQIVFVKNSFSNIRLHRRTSNEKGKVLRHETNKIMRSSNNDMRKSQGAETS